MIQSLNNWGQNVLHDIKEVHTSSLTIMDFYIKELEGLSLALA